MARRKSRGSKVSSKRSRRGRRVMNRSERRSKVSRKRSRVSRTNKRTSRVSRTNKRRKRSRKSRNLRKNKIGGVKYKDLDMSPEEADIVSARLAAETAALVAKAAEDRAYVRDINVENLRTWQSKLNSADAGSDEAAEAKEKVAHYEDLLK